MLLRNRAFDLFDEMFKDPFFDRVIDNGTAQVMKTDVREKDNGYLVDIELPGYAKEDIKAELKDGYLTITAIRNDNKEEKDEKGRYIRREKLLCRGECKTGGYQGRVPGWNIETGSAKGYSEAGRRKTEIHFD